MKARGDTDVQIVRYAFPSEVSLGRAGVEQLYQVKRMIRGIGNVPCSTYSQTENGQHPSLSFVNLRST